MNAIGRVRDAQQMLQDLLNMLEAGEVQLTAVECQTLTKQLQAELAKPIKNIKTNAQARAFADSYIEIMHNLPSLMEKFIKPTFLLRTQYEEIELDSIWPTEAQKLSTLASQIIHQLSL